MTLDEVAMEVGQPDFVKVDTEGHELLVLKGSPQVLAMGTRWMIEFHSQELYEGCKAVLEEAFYAVETVRHPHYAQGSHMWHQHGWLRAWPA